MSVHFIVENQRLKERIAALEQERDKLRRSVGIFDSRILDLEKENERLRAAVDKIETNMRRVIEQSKQPHATGSIFNTAVEAWANEIRALTTEGENDE